MPNVIDQPPFVSVEGAANMRTIGGQSVLIKNGFVKPGILYRSGDPSRITSKGHGQLHDLGITHIFDFRAESEKKGFDSVTPDIPGIEIVKVPVAQDKAFDPITLAARLKEFDEDTLVAFMKTYKEILDAGASSYERVFRHLIDNGTACLVHCTAGKDRAGLFAALTLLILGACEEDIVQDYALTNVGLEPVIPMLEAKFKRTAAYAENWEGFRKMGSAEQVSRISFARGETDMKCRPETMRAALQLIKSRYGGVEEYLKNNAHLTEDDIWKLRQRFTGS